MGLLTQVKLFPRQKTFLTASEMSFNSTTHIINTHCMIKKTEL